MRTEPDGKVTACKADSSGFDSHSALQWEAGLVPQSGSEPVPPVRSIRTFPASVSGTLRLAKPLANVAE
jgi:hypothetical protein